MNDPMQNIIAGVMAQVCQQVDAMVDEAGQLTLGEITTALDSKDPESLVCFRDGTAPGEIDSYRGYYRYPAVDQQDESKTVAEFKAEVNAAIGGTFTGYKGGEYTMSRRSPLWVSGYGMCSGVGVTGITTEDGVVYLETGAIEE